MSLDNVFLCKKENGADMYLMKLFFCSVMVVSLSGCGFIAQQIREKNREEYLLKTPGARDPELARTAQYATLKFKLLSRYSVKHAWPKGMRPCKYPRISLPESQKDGYWYGSYGRLGDIFEYKNQTLQERKTNGFPSRSIDIRYLTIDKYVRSDKYEYEGKIKEGGLKSICSQIFIGSNHTLTIWLRKWTKEQWLEKMTKNFHDAKFSKQRVGNNDWFVQETKLKPLGFRRVTGKFESWLLPIGDTGYTYYFDLGASTESLNKPLQHEKMKKIFRHLIESVKIEKLSKDESALASVKIKKLINEIEAYEAKRPHKK